MGYYDDTDSTSHGLLYDWPKGEFLRIDYSETSQTILYDINDLGQVVGIHRDGSGDSPFLFEKNGLQGLPLYQGHTTVYEGINDSGYIAGYHSYYYYSTHIHGVVCDLNKNSCQDIHYTEARHTYFHGINDLGQMIGEYQDWNGNWHGLLYNTGNQQFQPVEHDWFRATLCDINTSGQIVGWSGDNGILYDPRTGEFQTLKYPGADLTRLYGINDMGQIVGWYSNESGSHGLIVLPGTAEVPLPPSLLLLASALISFPILKKRRAQ